jgi:hypothetical protein
MQIKQYEGTIKGAVKQKKASRKNIKTLDGILSIFSASVQQVFALAKKASTFVVEA